MSIDCEGLEQAAVCVGGVVVVVVGWGGTAGVGVASVQPVGRSQGCAKYV